MDKHLGVFITLMNSHLHVSLNCAFNMITHHVTHLCMGHRGVGIMLLGCAHLIGSIEREAKVRPRVRTSAP